MRHGVPLGDRRLADEAEFLWKTGVTADIADPQRYDGVSLFASGEGTTIRRLIVEDRFAETFKVHVVELHSKA